MLGLTGFKTLKKGLRMNVIDKQQQVVKEAG
jgi:hypothetical protein